MDFNQQCLCIFHIVDMAPLTTAKRLKRYCEKNKAKLLERDALRKRLKRVK